jgi:hypothetical protein
MPPKTLGIAVLPQLPLCFGKLRKTLRDRAGLQRGASSLGRRQSFRQSARPACRGSCLQLAAPGMATLDWSLLTKRGTFVFSGANPLALLAGVCPRTQLQPLGRVGEGGLRYAPVTKVRYLHSGYIRRLWAQRLLRSFVFPQWERFRARALVSVQAWIRQAVCRMFACCMPCVVAWMLRVGCRICSFVVARRLGSAARCHRGGARSAAMDCQV